MSDHPGTRQSRGGGPRSWALHLLFAFVVTACAATTTTSTTTTGTGPSLTSTTQASTTTTNVATTQGIDAARLLSNALAATAPNYRFLSVVTVAGQTVTTIGGVVDGAALSAAITTGASSASYIRTSEGEWVAGPDEEWSELEGEAPAGPPLDALADATDLVVASADGTVVVIDATLGPAAGPVAGTRVAVTVVGDHITGIRYQAESAGDIAEVSTEVTDVGTAGTVAAPAA